jgi:hypothetical protein
MNDIHDGRVHGRCREIVICAYIGHLDERFPQPLRRVDVHCDELEYSVLGYDADDHGAVCLVVAIDDGDATRARLEHQAACFVYGAVGVDGDGFDGFDAERSFNLWVVLGPVYALEACSSPRRLFRRNWSTRASASGFCQ